LTGGFFVRRQDLSAKGLEDLIAELPAEHGSKTTAAKHDNNDHANDDGGVVLLGSLGGDGHFIHDIFSL
jgi:hypothetical protein